MRRCSESACPVRAPGDDSAVTPDLCLLTATELAAPAAGAGRVRPGSWWQPICDQIDRVNPAVNAVVTRVDRAALRAAAAADARAAKGLQLPPLHGLPIAHKDLVDTAGVRTTYGSPSFAEHVPTIDALARRAAARGGRDHAGKDQHARVRGRIAHLQPGLRRHPQSVVIWTGRRVAQAAARRRRWRVAWCRSPTAATSAARCETRRPGTASSACDRPRAWCRRGRTRRHGCPTRSTARWPGPWPTRRCCWPRCPAPIRAAPLSSYGVAPSRCPRSARGRGPRAPRRLESDARRPADRGRRAGRARARGRAARRAGSRRSRPTNPTSRGADAMFETWRALPDGTGTGRAVRQRRRSHEAVAALEHSPRAGADRGRSDRRRPRPGGAPHAHRTRSSSATTTSRARSPSSRRLPVEVEYPTRGGGRADGFVPGVDAVVLADHGRPCCPAISVPVGFTAAGLPVGLQLVAPPFAERALLELAHALERAVGIASRTLPPTAAVTETEPQSSPQPNPYHSATIRPASETVVHPTLFERMRMFFKRANDMPTADRRPARSRRADSGSRQAHRAGDAAAPSVPRERRVPDRRHGLLLGRRANLLADPGRVHDRRRLRRRRDAEPDLSRGVQRQDRPHRGRCWSPTTPPRSRPRRSSSASGRATTRPRVCARATTSARSTGRRSTGRTRPSTRPPSRPATRTPRPSPSAAWARSRPSWPRRASSIPAEDYHQQYLQKNPGGYCGIGGTGVSCPIGTGIAAA